MLYGVCRQDNRTTVGDVLFYENINIHFALSCRSDVLVVFDGGVMYPAGRAYVFEEPPLNLVNEIIIVLINLVDFRVF